MVDTPFSYHQYTMIYGRSILIISHYHHSLSSSSFLFSLDRSLPSLKSSTHSHLLPPLLPPVLSLSPPSIFIIPRANTDFCLAKLPSVHHYLRHRFETQSWERVQDNDERETSQRQSCRRGRQGQERTKMREMRTGRTFVSRRRCHRKKKKAGGGGEDGTAEWEYDTRKEKTISLFFLWVHTKKWCHMSLLCVGVNWMYFI